MPDIRYTSEAKADLRDIITYTIETFGVNQAQKYRAGLLKVFETIAKHPRIGTDLGDVRPGLRRLVHQAHAVYYRLEGDVVLIARILGPGQDPIQHF